MRNLPEETGFHRQKGVFMLSVPDCNYYSDYKQTRLESISSIKLEQNDTLTVTVDMTKGYISFYHNAKKLTGIPRPFFIKNEFKKMMVPCIDLCEENDTISII